MSVPNSNSIRASVMAVADEESIDHRSDQEDVQAGSFVDEESFEEIYHQELDLRFRVPKTTNRNNSDNNTNGSTDETGEENHRHGLNGTQEQISHGANSQGVSSTANATESQVCASNGSECTNEDAESEKQDIEKGAGLLYKDQVLTLLQPASTHSGLPIESAGASVSSLTTSGGARLLAFNPPVADAVYIPSSVAPDGVVVNHQDVVGASQGVSTSESNAASGRKKILLSVALAVLLTFAIVTTVFCTTGNCSTGTTTNSIGASSLVPTPSPTDSLFLALQTRDELRAAIVDYTNATDAAFSDAAMQYGYPIGSWDVSNITDFSDLFSSLIEGTFERYSGIQEFNEDLNGWNVSAATTMKGMFDQALAFNGDISSWDVGRVTNMRAMFLIASSFNGDISSWDVGKVTTMKGMFIETTAFKSDISSWSVGNVTDMTMMFARSGFNGDISSWDVAKVTNMADMFTDALDFSGDISSWDVGQVTNTRGMFQTAIAFNSDLSSWNVSNVKDASRMFSGSRLDRNLCFWRLRLPVDANVGRMFTNTFCPETVNPALPDGPMCHDCSPVPFQDTQELYDAVDEYIGVADPFLYSRAAATYGYPMQLWDVSQITNFDSVFDARRNPLAGIDSFSEDLEGWDVSAATTMSKMFRNAFAFNGDIASWDISRVEDISLMFERASIFNADLSAWDVGRVTTMTSMFFYANAFNADISAWNVSRVTDMSRLFYWAPAFKADLSGWDVGQVTDMSRTFSDASAFNADLSTWNVNRVIRMGSMFSYAKTFNADLSGWNVGQVTDMTRMFSSASVFNADISAWNVSRVTSIHGMFRDDSAFNADLSGWSVGRVMDMSDMFRGTSLDADISSWDVSQVTNMRDMFSSAVSFNQSLCEWQQRLTPDVDLSSMFVDTACPVAKSGSSLGPMCQPCDEKRGGNV